jgi:enoyl-CoA hydratase/carnithine racemase
MPHQFIQYAIKDRIAYITIDRPEVLNALHPPASQELREAFIEFRDDPETLVAIVTGTGDRAFCAGNDLKYQVEHVRPGEPYPDAGTVPFGGITSGFTCWKPIIAAVNGYAIGGGLELALACDLIVAAEHAMLGLPEPRVGLVAGAGGVHRLPRQVPYKVAMGMMMTGKHVTAAEAHRWGLVNEVVPLAGLMPAAERWAAEIMECAPLSVRATKQMATEGLGLPVDGAIARSYDEYDRAVASEDYVEGPRAFSEKRRPEWKGR